MAEEKFETNLVKMIAAELYYLASLQTAREIFSKSYFSLGAAEKVAVDQMVLGTIGANFQAITPQLLMGQTSPSTVGFLAQTTPAPKPSGTS